MVLHSCEIVAGAKWNKNTNFSALNNNYKNNEPYVHNFLELVIQKCLFKCLASVLPGQTTDPFLSYEVEHAQFYQAINTESINSSLIM